MALTARQYSRYPVRYEQLTPAQRKQIAKDARLPPDILNDEQRLKAQLTFILLNNQREVEVSERKVRQKNNLLNILLREPLALAVWPPASLYAETRQIVRIYDEHSPEPYARVHTPSSAAEVQIIQAEWTKRGGIPYYRKLVDNARAYAKEKRKRERLGLQDWCALFNPINTSKEADKDNKDNNEYLLLSPFDLIH